MKQYIRLMNLSFMICAIAIIWYIAEIAIYGAPQECMADTLVFLLFTITVYVAYLLGYQSGKEGKR